jgi:hypothetical protein
MAGPQMTVLHSFGQKISPPEAKIFGENFSSNPTASLTLRFRAKTLQIPQNGLKSPSQTPQTQLKVLPQNLTDAPNESPS